MDARKERNGTVTEWPVKNTVLVGQVSGKPLCGDDI